MKNETSLLTHFYNNKDYMPEQNEKCVKETYPLCNFFCKRDPLEAVHSLKENCAFHYLTSLQNILCLDVVKIYLNKIKVKEMFTVKFST